MKKTFTKLLTVIVLVLLTTGAMAQNTYYVNAAQVTSGDGKTWGTAFKTLQEALDMALLADGNPDKLVSGDQIWVAKGIYKPTKTLGGVVESPVSRDATFVLPEGVRIYGGFLGTTETNVGDRVFNLDGTLVNITTLSGDFGGNDAVALANGYVTGITNNDENAHHVVVSYNNSPATILDGFTISGGNANVAASLVWMVAIERNYAGGIFVKQSSPTLNNLIVKNNHAQGAGGIYLFGGKQDSNPAVTINISNSNIGHNISSATGDGGGGMRVEGYAAYTNKVELNNVNFFGNSADRRGGALYVINYLDLTVQGGTFSNNITTYTENLGGGAIYSVGAGEATRTKLKVYQAKFLNNTSGNFGGAFYSNNSSDNELNSCFFQENKASAGGAVYSAAGTSGRTITLNINNSVFYKNESNGNGGAITSTTGSTTTVTNATFYANTAKGIGLGGAVRRAGATLNVYNSIMHGNISEGNASTSDLSGTITLKNTLTQVSGANGVDGIIVNASPSYLFKNINDPLSPDFLKLDPAEGNPAIDAGDNALYQAATGEDPLLDKDFTGTAVRAFNSGLKPVTTIDMGAYENIVTPLPVVLSAVLSAKANTNSVLLAWATASETNNSHFILERSTDGVSFVAIATPASKGNGAKYSHTDFSPANGVNYYRLTQVDNDGTKVTYDPIAVNFGLNASAINVYPNPTSGATVNVDFGVERYDTLNVLSVSGQVLQSQNVAGASSAKVDVSALAKGVYLIKLSRSGTSIVQKLIKN